MVIGLTYGAIGLTYGAIKNIPFGTEEWRDAMIERYDLEQTMRGVGRPKKGG